MATSAETIEAPEQPASLESIEATIEETPEIITPEARQRCDRVAQALEVMYNESINLQNDPRQGMTQAIFTAIERFIAEIASDSQVAWPRCTWEFLTHAVGLTKKSYGLASTEPWRRCNLPRPVFEAITECYNFVESLRDLNPVSQDRIVYLEAITELVEARVSHPQIALIYDWLLPNGQPDLQKVKRCIRGEVEAPTQKILRPKMFRMPHLAICDAFLADLEMLASNEPIGDEFDDLE